MPLILCIEDEAALRQDLAAELREAGYSVLEAASGDEGVAALSTAKPDLILCDISMPGIGGFELLDHVRRTRPDLAGVPFVFLTALADRAHVIDGKLRGADDYLVKPIDYDLLLATIEARLQQIGRVKSRHNAEMEEHRTGLAELLAKGAGDAVRETISLFNYLQIGVVLLERPRTVRYTNDYAERLLRNADGLRNEQGLLTGSKTLREALEAAGAKSAPVSARAPAVVELPRPSGQRPYVATIFPLKPAAEIEELKSWTAVLISNPAEDKGGSGDLLQRLYGLTGAEAKLALALLRGQDIKVFAATVGISEGTARTQLKAVFAKTETHRQAQLVALLSRVCLTGGIDSSD